MLCVAVVCSSTLELLERISEQTILLIHLLEEQNPQQKQRLVLILSAGCITSCVATLPECGCR